MENYAIVDISGEQCKLTPDTLLRVPKLEAEVGAEVSLDRVLLWSDGKKVHIGRPFVEGKTVQAEVVRHGRAAKVIVFKKKRRKDYKRTKGHRQDFTVVKIDSILTK